MASMTANQENASASGAAATRIVSNMSVEPTVPSTLPSSEAITAPSIPPLPCGKAAGSPRSCAAANPQAPSSKNTDATSRAVRLSTNRPPCPLER